MTITRGSYTVRIIENGGDKSNLIAIMTYEGRCLHGMEARRYKTMKAAKRGADMMFKKVGR